LPVRARSVLVCRSLRVAVTGEFAGRRVGGEESGNAARFEDVADRGGAWDGDEAVSLLAGSVDGFAEDQRAAFVEEVDVAEIDGEVADSAAGEVVESLSWCRRCGFRGPGR
jgi:hypothetical protein